MIYDAIIIGAGPSGSSCALMLARAGWSVALIEKDVFPRRKVCGEFISATSLPLLYELGIADLYTQDGGPEVERVGIFAGNSLLTSPMPSAATSSGKWGRAFGREHLDAALLSLADMAGAKIWQPFEAKMVQRDGSLFICRIVSKQEVKDLSSRLLIHANGSWDPSNPLVKNDKHKSSDLLAFKAHFNNTTLNSDLMPLLVFPGGYGGLVHTDHGRVTLSCCIRRDRLARVRQTYPGVKAAEAVLAHIMATNLGARTTLQSAQRDGAWLSIGPIRPGIRSCYQDGVFYVGNMAGEAHPIVAEGISMAMQSAWLLTQILITNQHDLLVKKRGLASAGKRYQTEWAKQFNSRIVAAALFAQIAVRPWAAALVAPIFKCFPSLLTSGAKLSGKVKHVIPVN